MGREEDKLMKKKFKEEASLNPDKYYPTNFLKENGFQRQKCKKSGIYFWSITKRDVCGDPSVCGGFSFFGSSPAKKSLSYVETYKEFSKHMNKRGYEPIDRYSVVARWRDDTDFVQASIYDFQPFVVSGEVEPPSKKLVVPQFCLRFNDIDNVGITMSHFTGFVMIGQHTFLEEHEWEPEKYFKDLFEFFTEVMLIPKEELIIHEDSWAGGGNLGPCLEIFCRGLELANQVYMMYEIKDMKKIPLKVKVLDMGMGHERVSWFSQGKLTAYDATFPDVMQKLRKITKIKIDEDFFSKYINVGAMLNFDEIEDEEKTWKEVADKVSLSVIELKSKLAEIKALYSVAEHSRSLLVAISDGALPSNVKGGHNLRVILRRALEFIDENNWDINLEDVCEWHANYLKAYFPELLENLDHVKNIIRIEKEKFYSNKEKNKKIIEKLSDFSVNNLLKLYDSHGITPKEIEVILNRKLDVPSNFYAMLGELHEKEDNKTQTTKEKVGTKANKTNVLYFDHYDYVLFKADVLEIIKKEDKYFVALNQSAFYPTSGGQLHDTGSINGCRVLDVLKEGSVTLHVLDEVNFKVGEKVKCEIDFDRRLQLTQHHTATHIMTGSCRKILGEHIWQAGASKTLEKGRLDITHFEQLELEDIKKIEDLCNKVISMNLPVTSTILKRNVAEKLYGPRIYQGGAVPGKELRIVSVEDFDIEACGGTHVPVTGDVEFLKIMKTSKIQDGVVRIEFVAGEKAKKILKEEKDVLSELETLLLCEKEQIPGRTLELFSMWKKARKNKLEKLEFKSQEKTKENILKVSAENLKTQPEHVLKTVKKFLKDIETKLK